MVCKIPLFTSCCDIYPARDGVFILGYINIIYSSYNVWIYIHSLKTKREALMLYHGVVTELENYVYFIFFCIDLFFKIILVFAAHRRNLLLMKVSCYYALANLGLIIALEILQIVTPYVPLVYIGLVPLFLIGFAINVALYILIRSYTKELEMAVQSTEVVQFVNGEVKVEGDDAQSSAAITRESV